MATPGWTGWHSPAPAGHVRARMSAVVPAGSRGAAGGGEEVMRNYWGVSRREPGGYSGQQGPLPGWGAGAQNGRIPACSPGGWWRGTPWAQTEGGRRPPGGSCCKPTATTAVEPGAALAEGGGAGYRWFSCSLPSPGGHLRDQSASLAKPSVGPPALNPGIFIFYFDTSSWGKEDWRGQCSQQPHRNLILERFYTF